MLENLLTAVGVMVLLAVAVWAVMKRLERLDTCNPTPAMKRGEASKLWLLILALPVAGVVAVKTGHVDLARYCAAAALGVPWLFAGEKLWMSTAAFAATTEGDL